MKPPVTARMNASGFAQLTVAITLYARIPSSWFPLVISKILVEVLEIEERNAYACDELPTISTRSSTRNFLRVSILSSSSSFASSSSCSSSTSSSSSF